MANQFSLNRSQLQRKSILLRDVDEVGCGQVHAKRDVETGNLVWK